MNYDVMEGIFKGDYVSFERDLDVLFIIFEIDKINKRILVYDSCGDYKVWENISSVEYVLHLDMCTMNFVLQDLREKN